MLPTPARPRALRYPHPYTQPLNLVAPLTASEGGDLLPAPRLPVEGELLDADTPPDPHGVTATGHDWGLALVCRCLAWEAAVTGPGSLRFAQAEHRRHVEQARAADGG